MTTTRLFEHGKLAEAKTSAGTWPIRIITEGKGTSGVYPRTLLENEQNHVFGNRPMFGNHPKDPSKPWERSPFEIKAKLGPNIEYKVVDGVAGLYGEAIVSPEVDKWLEEFHDVIGVSIFASGESYEDENGESIVESFDGSDPYTSVDFVVAPGRGGGVEARMLEAYRAIEASASADEGTAPADRHNKESKENSPMEIEDLATKVDALTESLATLTSLLTPLAENFKPVENPEVDVAAAVESAYDKAVEAALPKELRKVVIEAAKNGEDVDAAITAQKAIVDAVRTTFEEAAEVAGRFGGSSVDSDDYTISSVRFN